MNIEMRVENISPRSHERGSIEATRWRGSRMAAFSSPRSHERGSIEAPVGGAELNLHVTSPRSHERGSIEARPAGAQVRRAWPSLRALTSAAPLKPSEREKARGVEACSPRSHERGSIEALASLPPGMFRFHSPRSHERGSIEAGPRFGQVAQTRTLSALSRARLH